MISLIKESVAIALGAKIRKMLQSAHQLDGKSPLKVVGETTIVFKRNDMSIILHALVLTWKMTFLQALLSQSLMV